MTHPTRRSSRRVMQSLLIMGLAVLIATATGCDSDDYFGADGVYGIVSAALALAAAIVSVV